MKQDNLDLDFLLRQTEEKHRSGSEREHPQSDKPGQSGREPIIVDDAPEMPSPPPEKPVVTVSSSGDLFELLESQAGPETDFDEDFDDEEEVDLLSELQDEPLILPLEPDSENYFDLDSETELSELLTYEPEQPSKPGLDVEITPPEPDEEPIRFQSEEPEPFASSPETKKPEIAPVAKPPRAEPPDLRALLDEIEGLPGAAEVTSAPAHDAPVGSDDLFTTAEDFAKAPPQPESEEIEQEFRLDLSRPAPERADKRDTDSTGAVFANETQSEPEVTKPEPEPLRSKSPSPFREDKPAPEFDKKATKKAEHKPPTPKSRETSGKTQKPRSRKWPDFSLASLFEDTRFLGLDLGSSSIKYVQIERRPRRIQLLNCGNFVLDPPDKKPDSEQVENRHGEILTERLRPQNFKNTLIKTAISGMEVIFKNIQLPKKISGRELQKAVPWACRKDLPFPIEATSFEFSKIPNKPKAADGQQQVFVVAAQKDLVSQHIRLLGETGIIPAKISTIPVALWHTFRTCVRKDQDACHAVVDIGANSSHIVFIDRGHLQFAREVTTAGDDFTKALAGTLFVDGKEIVLSKERAEIIKQKYGLPHAPATDEIVEGVPLIEVSAMLGQVLDKLVTDLQRTIDFYKEKFNGDGVKKIYLTGGGAMLANLTGRLSQELKVDVAILNPFETLSLQKFKEAEAIKKAGPRFAVAVGLALDRGNDMNLLPPDLKRTHVWQYFKRILRYLSVITLLAMMLLSQNISRQFSKLQQRLVTLQTEFQKTAPRRQRFQELQHDLQQLNGELQNFQIMEGRHDKAAVYMKVLSNLLPRQMSLTSVRLTRGLPKNGNLENAPIRETLTIDGIAFENGSMQGMNLAKFLLALENSGYFQIVVLRNQNIREDGHLQFTLDCEM